jgi:hypothetical protein
MPLKSSAFYSFDKAQAKFPHLWYVGYESEEAPSLYSRLMRISSCRFMLKAPFLDRPLNVLLLFGSGAADAIQLSLLIYITALNNLIRFVWISVWVVPVIQWQNIVGLFNYMEPSIVIVWCQARDLNNWKLESMSLRSIYLVVCRHVVKYAQLYATVCTWTRGNGAGYRRREGTGVGVL